MAAVSCARLLSPGSVHGLRLGSRLLPALSRVSLVRCHRLGPADDELYQRTTVTLLQKEAAGGAVIYSYSPRGFNISGNKVLGPCAVLPPAVLQWNVGHHTDITVESLSLFYLLEPRIVESIHRSVQAQCIVGRRFKRSALCSVVHLTADVLLFLCCRGVSGALPQARSGDDELYQRTTVTLLQKKRGRRSRHLQLQPRGFNISGNKVLGRVRRPSPAVLQWNVGSSHRHHSGEFCLCFTCWSHASLWIVTRADGGFTEILVLGTGARTERLDPNVLDFLKKKGIAVEVQDTPNACATFNFLSSERRLAAAGLIPPPAAE
ncbi:hypothetical protein cypCar_00037944 [Cyprinus carpio]|nr:hypothetical protein cypCar_00037944 [Cyprinus carpio]